jgi:tRNA (cmo5U34)-methyltransferase
MCQFSDRTSLADYAERSRRLVPGLVDMQRMAAVLVAEHAPDDARVLVVGAGGGLELKAFAEFNPTWRLDGVDPSTEMLELARATLGASTTSINLYHGTIDIAPDGPYDAATCLLTLHFIAAAERLRTLQGIRRRLKPGSPFVAMHLSFGQSRSERDLWLSRYAAYATSSGVDPDKARLGAATIGELLNVLAPEEDEALMTEAGFGNINVFYAGLAFRGWVAQA